MRMYVRGLPLTVHQAALLGLMRNYLAGVMDVGVSLPEIHKLMYFLQAAGEPLKLDYKQAVYGPYAENLRHVLKAMESHTIHGYGEEGDDPRKPIELAEGAAEEGFEFLRNHPETLERFEKVSGLIEGFESPYGMELLATVHWVADRQGARTVDEAVQKVHGWNARKTMFTPHQIQAAWDRLRRSGWIDGPLDADGHV